MDVEAEVDADLPGGQPVRAMPWLVMAALELAILVAAVGLVFWALR
jgi:hypothetical protein